MGLSHYPTFTKNPTSSAFNKFDHNNYLVSYGLMNKLSMRIERSRDKLRSQNSCHSTSSNRISTVALESKMILAKDKKEIDLLNLMTCDNDAHESSDLIGLEAGLGITNFLRGKSFLITGATGFLGKILIEKILRTMPDVRKIYVLVKAKSKKAAFDRINTEILNTDLFRVLRESIGSNFQSFMMKKLIPVIGNVREVDMGIEAAAAEEISNEVDIIINSAANTTFDERYEVALDINTIGPSRLLRFAKRFKSLKLFLQVSTAYVNGRRQGRILEKPFCSGDNIAKELVSSDFPADALPLLDIESEIRLAFGSMKLHDDPFTMQKMKDLGQQRANIYGWQDTYTFTKAMAEMAINSMRDDIPVVIIRPSIIESTWREPFPGWIEGSRMIDPIVLSYGKGQLSSFLADPETILDVVPADMVVNAMLAAMAKHGHKKEPQISIYHIASSTTNPLLIQDLNGNLYQYFRSFPFLDSKGRPIQVSEMSLFDNMTKFSNHLQYNAMHQVSSSKSKSPKFNSVCMKLVDRAKHLASIYEPYCFYCGRFDNANTQKLMAEMSDEERREFCFDIKGLVWKDYISKVHIPGLLRYVMKGRGMMRGNCNEVMGTQV